MKRRFFHALAAATFGLGLTPSLWAQLPSTTAPIKIVIGNAPGGISDTMGRLLAEQFTSVFNRNFLVENRPGAGGNIAADLVAKSPPDGQTMLLIYNSHPSINALYPNLPFDPIKDFSSIGMIVGTPYLLVANPALPGKNLAEVLVNARRSGRPLTFASPGSGSPQHLMAERLGIQTGIPVTVAHYKGMAPAQTDVLGGHVDFTISSVAIGMPQVKAGKLKVLAVTSPERLPELPNDPTVKESGVDGFVGMGWLALLVPAKTPAATAMTRPG